MKENDLTAVVEYARSAENDGDWQAALDRWENALSNYPLAGHLYIGCAKSFINLGRFAEAKIKLNIASEKFPKNHDVWHDLARLAERQEDWPEAERCWDGFLKCDGHHWWSYTALAFSLHKQNKSIEAENFMLNAQIKHPGSWELQAEHARYSGRVGNLSGALEQWCNALKNNPNIIIIHIGYAEALIEVDRIVDAYNALTYAARKFPNDAVIWQACAKIAERQKKWIEVEYFCRKYHEKEGSDWNITTLLALSILSQNRNEEFIIIFNKLIKDNINNIHIIANFVLLCEKFSISHDNLNLLEAEIHIRNSNFEFSDYERLLFTFSKIAKLRQDYSEYRKCSQLYYSKYPSNYLSREMFFEACELCPKDNDINYRNMEELAELSSTNSKTSIKEFDHDVLIKFESLGGNIGGCEFGFIQRRYEVESLSLLRWASISIENLIFALNNRFSGVGIIENILIEKQQHYDWRARDTSYDIQMDHTHLDQKTVIQEVARKQLSVRMSFLARKLISDLEDGDKIFVYRYSEGVIPDGKALQLRKAISKYNIRTKLIVVQETKEEIDSIRYEIIDNTLIYATRKETVAISNDILLPKVSQWESICMKAIQEFI